MKHRVSGLLVSFGCLGLSGCGAAKVSAEVPLTLSSTTEPRSSVDSSPDSATIVFIYDGFPLPKLQAITMVSEQGEFLGQLRPHSWLVAQVKSGRTGIYVGRPELGYYEWCSGIRGQLAPGKIYVLSLSSFFGTAGILATDKTQTSADEIGARLSLFSELAPDLTRGQAETNRVKEGYWQPCFDAQAGLEKNSEQYSSSQLEHNRRSLYLLPENGYDRLAIPPPP